MSESTTTSAPPRPASENGNRLPRVTLKPAGSPSGHVDGAWWPMSRDLAAELPGLLARLPDRLGRVERVSHHLTEWGPVARKVPVGNAVVRLAGYRSQHANTIDLISAGQQITLLVVPPEASAELAHGALTAAAREDNVDQVDDLLAARPRADRP